METTFICASIEEARAVAGAKDENLRYLQKQFPDCRIIGRGEKILVMGEEAEVQKVLEVLRELSYLFKENTRITPHHIRFTITMVREGRAEELRALYEDTVNITAKGRVIKPKTWGQKRYVDSIRTNLVTFGIGPAGTGKTYLAVAMAAFYLKNRMVDRIVLTRPAVEAGEKLGYLPGDMQEKVDPYLRPLYDALADLFGYEQFLKFQAKNIIEVAPLAYMRGRTLESAFIILDEAQNTTPEQMKMFLTRMGDNSRMVINGDATQIDLPIRIKSGLVEAEQVLKGVRGIGMIYFDETDVVRHDMVSRIVQAYERFQKRSERT